MSEGQKVIKYCAIAFAVFLTVAIISGIASVAFTVIHAIAGDNDKETGSWDAKTVDVSKTFTGVESLDIDNSTGELQIREGNEFKVEAVNVSEKFMAKVDGNGTLTIKDRSREIHFLWFNVNGFDNPDSKIILYVPADFIADEAKLDTGAGNVSVEGLNADYLYLSAGAGNITGSNITAQEAKIDGGVGKIELSDVNLNDADFDCGVGNIMVDGILLGKTKLDCGVGKVDINLKGKLDDYGLDVDSGIGSIHLNGKKISDDQRINKEAKNQIKVDGGIGQIEINIAE